MLQKLAEESLSRREDLRSGLDFTRRFNPRSSRFSAAKLASKIGDNIKRQTLTQQQAAKLLAMPQRKVSLLLRGQFRGIGEAKMLECLARLGRRY